MPSRRVPKQIGAGARSDVGAAVFAAVGALALLSQASWELASLFTAKRVGIHAALATPVI